ncbi:CPBP family intramembrane metalloprotease [Leptospira gomenensis]|uniref:CPBP family intramembrane metalloprotease n=1 Tax=Leptospira gomenensis TaxID=2484974 RepID=A0A5F1Z450_9LEPT|nr:CPBP family intramembrane glutamic endopeptidase [Leptospira gomenensis]TGK28788.1 CPBP family intramembrane metalloprotease [Leptospira gomenensis]TGK37625.1 CPBP family intramembrane metalloprotease [Leptospira gomenensis]TGK51546.1 CPBP family intramembrane metalloprotease [Leptospira gomenensis]TGK68103.1 CPBP family intramembrane metalloprotease [Leptospira gomenensis]
MEIVRILRGFFRKNSRIYSLLFGLYGTAFVFLFLNEEFGFPIFSSPNLLIKISGSCFLYGILILGFYLVLSKRKKEKFRRTGAFGFLFSFWFCLVVLEFLQPPYEKILIFLPKPYIFWAWKVLKQFTQFFPLLLFPVLYDFYRSKIAKIPDIPFEKKGNPSYFPILVGGFVLAGFGSLIPGFQEFYPRAPLSSEQLLYRANWFTTLSFEFVYLSTFYFTEFFFRKFLIRYLSVAGKYHSVGMAALVYGIVHFEKPQGEILSSFFGGLVMGALSLRTRSIRGGLYAHIALAAGMELFAGLYVWNRLF